MTKTDAAGQCPRPSAQDTLAVLQIFIKQCQMDLTGETISQGQEGPTSAMSSALKDIHETEHVKDNLLQEQQVLQGQLDCCEFSGRWLIVV